MELSVIKVNNDDKIKLTAMAGTGNQTIYTTTVDPNTASLDEVLLQVADIANADMTVTVVPGTITLPGTTSNVKTYTGKDISIDGEADPIEFVVIVRNDAADMEWEHRIQVYHTNSDTEPQLLRVWYMENGNKVYKDAVASDGVNYSVVIPGSADIVDIEMVAPNNLSSLMLTPTLTGAPAAMTKPARGKHTVTDYPLTQDVTPFDLDITALDGTLGEYTLTIYRNNRGIFEVKVNDDATTLTPGGVSIGSNSYDLYEYTVPATDAAARSIYISANSSMSVVSAGLAGALTTQGSSIWRETNFLLPATVTTPVVYTELEILVDNRDGTQDTAYLQGGRQCSRDRHGPCVHR